MSPPLAFWDIGVIAPATIIITAHRVPNIKLSLAIHNLHSSTFIAALFDATPWNLFVVRFILLGKILTTQQSGSASKESFELQAFSERLQIRLQIKGRDRAYQFARFCSK